MTWDGLTAVDATLGAAQPGFGSNWRELAAAARFGRQKLKGRPPEMTRGTAGTRDLLAKGRSNLMGKLED